MPIIICEYCQSRVLDTERKCPSCGSIAFRPLERLVVEREQPLERMPPIEFVIPVSPKSPKNRWLALVLCLVGGIFGVHRFYVGKIRTGVLFLFTFGFWGIGVLVDFLTILFGYFRDKEGLLLRS